MNRTAIIVATMLATSAAWACSPRPGEHVCIDEHGMIQPPFSPNRQVYSTTSTIKGMCVDSNGVTHLCPATSGYNTNISENACTVWHVLDTAHEDRGENWKPDTTFADCGKAEANAASQNYIRPWHTRYVVKPESWEPTK